MQYLNAFLFIKFMLHISAILHLIICALSTLLTCNSIYISWNIIIEIVTVRHTRIYTHERLIIIFLWTFYTTQILHSVTWTTPHCQLSLSGVSKAIVILLREREWERNTQWERNIYIGDNILVSEGLNWTCNFSTFRETAGKEELDISSLFKVNILISSHTCYCMGDRQRSLSTFMYTA